MRSLWMNCFYFNTWSVTGVQSYLVDHLQLLNMFHLWNVVFLSLLISSNLRSIMVIHTCISHLNIIIFHFYQKKVLLLAMHQLQIPLECEESVKSRDFILREAGNPDIHRTSVRIIWMMTSIYIYLKRVLVILVNAAHFTRFAHFYSAPG